jgi:hypothetical protein
VFHYMLEKDVRDILKQVHKQVFFRSFATYLFKTMVFLFQR